jgi:hypothetical protein
MKLNELELIAITGLQAKQREMVLVLMQEQAMIFRNVEKRLNLEEGAIGKTHEINLDTADVLVKGATAEAAEKAAKAVEAESKFTVRD